MKEVAILGVAMHPWGKIKEKSVPELNLEVAQGALKDAGLEWKDIQFVVAGSDPWSGVDGLLAGCRLSQKIGNNGIPVVNVYNACATGGYALKTAQAYINSGFCDYALVTAASISPAGFFGVTHVGREDDPNDLDAQRFRIPGLTNPTGFAFMATYRMHHYGVTENDLALVKVKNSKFGALNPLARFKKVFTVEDVFKSPMVTYPLRLYELCATSDGAAAIVLSSMKAARKHARKPVRLAGVGISTPKYPDPRSGGYGLDIASDSGELDFNNGMGVRSAYAAYEEAGIGPEDLDLAEVYDLSSAFELGWYEEIGLCKRGDAEKLLREGATGMGGRIPVNTSGGCASFGEAIPAQALAQVCELTWQMRGMSGPRQVEGAKVGCTVNAGKQGNCSATVVKK
jgi:acetyl-CoA acetyltransferase